MEHYIEYIQNHPDWVLAGIFADDGISGTNTKKRTEFNRMIDECMAGNIDMIITKSISRFARNPLDCLKYIRQLKGPQHGSLTIGTEKALCYMGFIYLAVCTRDSKTTVSTWLDRPEMMSDFPCVRGNCSTPEIGEIRLTSNPEPKESRSRKQVNTILSLLYNTNEEKM